MKMTNKVFFNFFNFFPLKIREGSLDIMLRRCAVQTYCLEEKVEVNFFYVKNYKEHACAVGFSIGALLIPVKKKIPYLKTNLCRSENLVWDGRTGSEDGCSDTCIIRKSDYATE